MKCPICKKSFDHPVRRGRRAQFCGDKCRTVHRKEWRKNYDAQPLVKGKKRLREMARWRSGKRSRAAAASQRRRQRRERQEERRLKRLARLGL